jgi:uncharacterized protein with NRDE domain
MLDADNESFASNGLNIDLKLPLQTSQNPEMCVFAALFRVLPGCPLLILSNRDENRGRETLPPQVHAEAAAPAQWLGGLDRQAGGTWLGLNRFGLIVAVTNRPKTDVPPGVRSRGLLCRQLLTARTVEQALTMARHEMDEHTFAGFNLLMLSAAECVVIEAGDDPATHRLLPGTHVIANRNLNDPDDLRTRRATEEVERRLNQSHDWPTWITLSQEMCSLPADGERPGLCLTGLDWGTVSSTVIALPDDRGQTRYEYAPGPPASTPYDDYSIEARRLLDKVAGKKAAHKDSAKAAPHRMHLRGPWEYAWGGETGRVKLPAEWRMLFGDRAGTVTLRRRFGRPTNLEQHERVFVAFGGLGGTARIRVNGVEVGAAADDDRPVRFDVTTLLKPSNQIEIELTFDPLENANRRGGLWAPVAIEVHSSN